MFPPACSFFFFFCGLLSSQWTFYYSYFFSISRLNHLPLSPGWPFGSLVCKMSGMVQGISVSASVFTLVAIAVDRYDSRCPHAHHHTPCLCISRLFLFDCRLGRMQRSLLGVIPISSKTGGPCCSASLPKHVNPPLKIWSHPFVLHKAPSPSNIRRAKITHCIQSHQPASSFETNKQKKKNSHTQACFFPLTHGKKLVFWPNRIDGFFF